MMKMIKKHQMNLIMMKISWRKKQEEETEEIPTINQVF
jgi:hypothetical protein